MDSIVIIAGQTVKNGGSNFRRQNGNSVPWILELFAAASANILKIPYAEVNEKQQNISFMGI